MSFGSQTVTLIAETPTGPRNELGVQAVIQVRTDVAGCLFRPSHSEEAPDEMTNVATMVWKCTAPPGAEVVVAKSTGLMEVDGIVYKIIGGAKSFPDLGGTPFKVTIFCQVHDG